MIKNNIFKKLGNIASARDFAMKNRILGNVFVFYTFNNVIQL